MSRAAGLIVTGLAVVILTPLMALMAMGEPPPPHDPSPAALADIPLDLLDTYRAAAAPCAVPWEAPAAIAKVSSDHGRTANPAGLMGPLPSTAVGDTDVLRAAAFLCGQGATDPARLPAALAALNPDMNVAQVLHIAESYRDLHSPTSVAP